MSADTRFDAAYKCVIQCAMLRPWANGCCTATSQPRHHQTAIQCLSLRMAVSIKKVIVLDGLRKQRNLSDYSGDPVSEATLSACLEEADKLLAQMERRLRDHHPDLLESA